MANVIQISRRPSARTARAAADLQRFLGQATGTWLPISSDTEDATSGVRFVVGHAGDDGAVGALAGQPDTAPPSSPESFRLCRIDEGESVTVAVIGRDEAGSVYGVFHLLEIAYGCAFLFGSEVVPEGTAPLVPDQLDVARTPAFATRGLLPWYDFLSGPTAWNLPDYRLYVDRAVRLGLNFIGLHVYSSGMPSRAQGAEPFLSFSYHGISHEAFLDTTDTYRWGYLPKRTGDFAFGTDYFFERDAFGADAALDATDSADRMRRAKGLLREALAYAKAQGLRVCIGFEPAAVPDEIVLALPESARLLLPADAWHTPRWVLNTTSEAAREILRLRLDDLLETYPDIDAIWLWQNEDAAWTTRLESETLAFDPDYIQQAQDYLRERAPAVKLVVSGWGAVHSLLDEMHAVLPSDITFSALNHYLGTEQTDPVYGRLGERSRWPVPWLEDDATLWHPQYHVNRFHNDISRARDFGCDGMIGIHWRTRVIDHVATYFARALWDTGLSPTRFYSDYARALVGEDNAATALAAALSGIDASGNWPGRLTSEFVGSKDWNNGHSNEATAAFEAYPVSDEVTRDFGAFADALDAITVNDPAAAERLDYLRAQVHFVLAYRRSQDAARALDETIARSHAEGGRLDDEATGIATAHLEDVYAAVSEAVPVFGNAMTTTADLGVIASLNQKYVTRAMWQRYDALREVVADPSALPRPLLTAVPGPFRVFVPVPPEGAVDGCATIRAITSAPARDVAVTVTPLAGGEAQTVPLVNRNRGVWEGTVPVGEAVRLRVEATSADGQAAAFPVGGQDAGWTATAEPGPTVASGPAR